MTTPTRDLIQHVKVPPGAPGLGPNSALAERAPDLLARAGSAGPVVLHGLDITSPERLHEALTTLGLRKMSYVQGNSPRTELSAMIFTATDFPPAYPISLHNELSYTSHWPQFLVFACVEPAAGGGATTVADGAAVAEAMPPGLLAKCRDLGFRYHQYLHGGRGVGVSWQATFQTEDPDEVERVLATEAGASFQWTDDGGIEVLRVRPGLAEHPVTGATVWFNQAEQWDPSSQPPDVAEAIRELLPVERWPHRVLWNDGTVLQEPELAAIRAVYVAHTRRIDWGRGDLAVIDNVSTMHGREPFEGERSVMVSLAESPRRTATEAGC